MTAQYPTSLPAPIRAPFQSAERRILSTLPGPRNARALQHQRMAGQEVEFVFTYAEAQVFADWFKNDLVEGGAWFTADWPLPQGGTGTRRFVGAPSSPTYVPTMGWHVTAQCVVLDAGEFACTPWTQVGEVPGVSEPVVFGSGVYCERDPATGLIWALWCKLPGHDTPVGAGGPMSGAYVLVYDPIALTLVDSIQLSTEDNVPFRSIVHLDGHFYIGIEGNTYSAFSVVSKVNAASRAIISQADTDYGGAVSDLGLISRDRSGLFMSVCNGIGSGTSAMSTDAPFAAHAYGPASNWYFNWAYNDFSRVRAYTGYGHFVDLRGAVDMSVDTSPYIDAAQLLETRLLVKPCSPIVYLLDINNAGVLAVNTATGAVQVVSSTMRGLAMFYSPESDTLYVEGREPAAALSSRMKAYQGTTFEELGEIPAYVSGAAGNHGNSVYIGGEAFVGAEETISGGRLWRSCFPH